MEKYLITLEEEVVKEVKKRIKNYGGKLSTLINHLLKEWLKKDGRE